MLKISELLVKNPAKSIALLAGAGFLVAVLPLAFKSARPLTRKMLKSVLLLTEKGKVLAAESVEDLEDLLAEVKSEMAETRQVGSVPEEEEIEALGDPGH